MQKAAVLLHLGGSRECRCPGVRVAGNPGNPGKQMNAEIDAAELVQRSTSLAAQPVPNSQRGCRFPGSLPSREPAHAQHPL